MESLEIMLGRKTQGRFWGYKQDNLKNINDSVTSRGRNIRKSKNK